MRKYATPMFQHRHYAAIAKVLSEHDTTNRMTAALSDMFAGDNPNFNRARFSAAARGAPINGRDTRDAVDAYAKAVGKIMREAAE